MPACSAVVLNLIQFFLLCTCHWHSSVVFVASQKQQLVAHACRWPYSSCRWPYSSWGGWTSWPFRVPSNSDDSEAQRRCSCRECWQRCMCRGVPSELPCLQAGIPLIWKKTFGSNPASASSSWWLQVLWGDANVKYIIWLCERADPALWGHGSTLLLKVCVWIT